MTWHDVTKSINSYGNLFEWSTSESLSPFHSRVLWIELVWSFFSFSCVASVRIRFSKWCSSIQLQPTHLHKVGVAPSVLWIRPVSCFFARTCWLSVSPVPPPCARTPPADLVSRHSISLQWPTKHILVPKTRLWELLSCSAGILKKKKLYKQLSKYNSAAGL